jgi:hypothetical protein
LKIVTDNDRLDKMTIEVMKFERCVLMMSHLNLDGEEDVYQYKD